MNRVCISLGGTAATSVTVVSSTSITATTPAHAAGAVNVVVTNTDTKSGTLTNGYTYSSGSGGTISFVQANTGPSTVQSSNTSVSVTYSSAQTAGDLNIVVIGWGDTTSSIGWVFDTQGNTYQRAVGPTATTGLQQSIYYAKNIAGGSNTVSVTFNQAAAYPDVRILEYRGADPTNPLDITAAAVGTGTSANSGSATTTLANELIFGAGTTKGKFSAAGTGFTSRVLNIFGNIAEDKTVTSSGSYNTTATTSSANWIMQMATFSSVRISRIRMHEVTSPVVGYRYASLTQGQGTTTSVVNSVGGPTSGAVNEDRGRSATGLDFPTARCSCDHLWASDYECVGQGVRDYLQLWDAGNAA